MILCHHGPTILTLDLTVSGLTKKVQGNLDGVMNSAALPDRLVIAFHMLAKYDLFVPSAVSQPDTGLTFVETGVPAESVEGVVTSV